MNQTIYKMAGKRDPFARIPHTMLEDESLSWRAKGVLAYLCGKPDGWKTRVADICNHGKEGKHAVRSALRELRDAGYAELSPAREGGRIREWVWKVSDSPIFKPPDTDFQHLEIQHLENQHHSKKEMSKKDCSKKTKETKETPSGDGASFSSFRAVWKPLTATKEEQLSRIEPTDDFPTEEEFNDFIDTEGITHIADTRCELYRELCEKKWHHWNGRRWVPVRDWTLYVRALDQKIYEAASGAAAF